MDGSAIKVQARKRNFRVKSIMRFLLNIGLSAKMGLLVIVGTVSMISLFTRWWVTICHSLKGRFVPTKM